MMTRFIGGGGEGQGDTTSADALRSKLSAILGRYNISSQQLVEIMRSQYLPHEQQSSMFQRIGIDREDVGRLIRELVSLVRDDLSPHQQRLLNLRGFIEELLGVIEKVEREIPPEIDEFTPLTEIPSNQLPSGWLFYKTEVIEDTRLMFYINECDPPGLSYRLIITQNLKLRRLKVYGQELVGQRIRHICGQPFTNTKDAIDSAIRFMKEHV